jgi:hypothetical protein
VSNFAKVQLKDQYGFAAECTPMDELRTAKSVRLVGSTFVGGVVDTNFWATTITTSGTAVQANGEVVLGSGASATGAVTFQSNRKGRYVGGSSNRYRAQIQMGDAGVVNNVRRWGMFDGTDGAYFMLSGSSSYVATRRNGTETAVLSANWNGSTSVPAYLNCNTFEIYITNRKVYFVIAGTLVHTVDSVSQTWTATTTLPVRADNTNVGSVTNSDIRIRVNTLYRLGELETLPTYKHILTAATTVCKRGSGNLHRIVVNSPTNNPISVFDSLGVTGTASIAVINPAEKTDPFCLEYHLPFADGLTILTAGTPDLTIVYE